MTEGKGKKRLRFTFEDDVILLREVVSRNPFKYSDAWEEIQKNVFLLTRKQFLLKSIRQHIQLLLELWILKEKSNEKSSGIEEPYSEKDVLLQEVKELVEVHKKEKSCKQKNKLAENEKTEIGKNIRNEAALRFLEKNACMMDHDYNGDIIIDGMAEVPSENLETPDNDERPILVETEKETPNMNIPTQEMSQSRSNSAPGISGKTNSPKSKNILGPIRTRAKRTTYIRRSGLEYLKEKHEKEMELEAKRLILEERKVAVSERTIALAEKKLSVESENFRNIYQSQQHIIENLLNIVKDLKRNNTQS